MADVFADPTAAGSALPDPSAPVFIAPMALPQPDPVYRDDAVFAAAGGNWRAVPVPPPPIPVLDESGQLTLIEPSAADLRDQAVAALHAPTGSGAPDAASPRPPATAYPVPGSRGGGRSTYTAPPPPSRSSRRPPPARPPGSVTTSPTTWLPNLGGSTPTTPNPTVAWQPSPPPPTWAPSAPTDERRRGAPGPVAYRAQGRNSRAGGSSRTRRRSAKGWIPGVVVLLIVVGVKVGPHLGSLFHHGPPAAVDQAVNRYYDSVQSRDVPGAGAQVCSSLRPSWTTGQARDTSDTKRHILGHAITATRSDGSARYTVGVSLDLSSLGTGSHSAALTVVKDSGQYRVCGGTTP